MMIFSGLIKKILRNFGIIAMRRSSQVYLPDEDSFLIALKLAATASPVVIDGGAHKGAAVNSFRALAPDAEFYCFEPDPLLAGDLLRTYAGDKKVTIIQAALGERSGKAVFHINASRPTNSLLKAALGVRKDLDRLSQTLGRIEVTVMTIDDYCDRLDLRQIDIVKLDLQGYDYLALKGASKTLGRVRVVLVEALFAELYEGCHQFPDILFFMMERGFRLYTISGIHYGDSGELLWADVIFVRESK